MSRVRSDMMSFRCDDEGRLRAAAEGAPAAFGEVRGKSAERPVDPAVYLEDGDLQPNAEHHGGGDLRVMVRDLAARDGRLDDALQRSDERRVGTECVCKGWSRRPSYHYKHKTTVSIYHTDQHK